MTTSNRLYNNKTFWDYNNIGQKIQPMKKFLLILAISCLAGRALAQNTADTLRILTYNVHNNIGMDGTRDYRRIADAISRTSPDLVALQELDSVTRRNEGVYALDTLSKLTGMKGFYASAIPYDGGSYGIGILCRQKPTRIRTMPMPGREEKRTMLIAEFPDYVFCATHQSLTPEDQVASVALIAQALEGTDKPAFLAGDMNALPLDKPQVMLGDYFVTLNDTAAYTFPADVPDQCLDYIYGYIAHGQHYEVLQTEVLNEPVASDHRPVRVVVRMSR